MLISYHRGQGSIVLRVKIPNSTTTDNSGVTGLLFSTTGLLISTIADNEATPTVYSAAGSTTETITTLGTFAAPTATKCRFKEVDATNHKGVYELQFADARYAVSNAKSLLITIGAITASNVAQVDVLIPLIDIDPYNAMTGGIGVLAVRTATAQNGGNASSIKLDASASAVNNIYTGAMIFLTGGTGIGQIRTIIAYNGNSKVATVDRNFVTSPDNTTTFAILPTDSPALNATLQVTANVSQAVIRSGTAQAGSTISTVKLDAGASATNNIYIGDLITLTGGTGVGQSRTILSYNGTTKVATIDRNWNITPDNTSTFNILASTTPSTFSDQGVAQAGGASTITLQDTASSVNDVYNGSIVTILSGTGSGQTREITGYVEATKVATVDAVWSVNPDSTSAYAIIPTANSDTASTGDTPGTTTLLGLLTPTRAGYIDALADTIDANVIKYLGIDCPASAVAGTIVSGLADDYPHGGTPGSSTATFAVMQMALVNTANDDALLIKGTDCIHLVGDSINGGRGLRIQASGGYPGIVVDGDTGAQAVILNGGLGAAGALSIYGSTGPAIDLASDQAPALSIYTSGDVDGIKIVVVGTGHAINAAGGTVSGDAIHLTHTSGNDITAQLAPNALDLINLLPPDGPAADFLTAMTQLFYRYFPPSPSGQTIKNSGDHTIITKDSTGTLVTTQTYTDDGSGNEVINSSS